VFQTDIAKADRDVAYVAMVVYLCYKGLLPMFYLCFGDICCKCVYLDVAFVSHICCRHFICMLRIFAMIFKCFQKLFLVFQKHVSSVSSVFFFLRVNGGRGSPPEDNFIDLGPVDPSWFENTPFTTALAQGRDCDF
jgi:hypothetical protein